jgi:primosomal protein N''
MTSDSILGGLIGSLITVIVTKLLDMLQKANEHDYPLRKAFFKKKLVAAESAVAREHIADK